MPTFVFKLRRVLCAPFSAKGREFLILRTFAPGEGFYFKLAWLWRRTFARRQKVVLVVGSFGKTTTTRAIQTAFGIMSDTVAKNFNYSGLIAWNFLRLPVRQPVVVIEVGIKHPGQMARFVAPLKPDAVVVTCIGDEHIFSFGTREGIREEKTNAVRLLRPGGIAILNGDDPNVRWMAEQTRARVVWYGFEPTNAYRADSWDRNWPGLSRLHYTTPGGPGCLETDLIARESCYAPLAALAAAVELGCPLATAARRLHAFATTPGRLNRLRSPHGFWLIRDDFKSTLETIHLAMDLVRDLPARIILVLGGIDAPAGTFATVHRNLAKFISAAVDEVILVKGTWRDDFSPEFRRQVSSTSRLQRFQKVDDYRAAIEAVRLRAQPDEVVLIKGRTNEGLGRIADALMTPPS